jgi:exodeoxyribonuclease V beta subunit
MKVETWTGTEPLPSSGITLLEASAGTGKTWQIEALVVRLVAEEGVPVEEILVITFTNAATAELRARIRARLVAARDALLLDTAPDEDPVLHGLWEAEDVREQRRTRLSAALANFDLAPISTIHGFSQRMLDQLAFQSGQEPGLELLADPGAILDQLVDDSLARTFAEATEVELAVLSDMGWTRGDLREVAKLMNKAVAPVLEPGLQPGESRESSPLSAVREWMAIKKAALEWLEGDAGEAAIAAVGAEQAKKSGKRLDGRKLNKKVVGEYLDALREWLSGDAPRSARVGTTGFPLWMRKFTLAGLAQAWRGTEDELASFDGRPLFATIDQLFADQDRLWPMPLVVFAAGARARVESELVRTGRLTYSSMLSRLAERVAEQASDPEGGALAKAIRSRFQVALVDEFQDTDGAQWPVMRAVFEHPDRRLFIIGDPKQAIYAFRGADVHVYLDAARVADRHATMRINWRSDARYIHAMNHLWWAGSKAFELGDVDYVEVGASKAGTRERIRGLPACEARPRRAFELRWVDGRALSGQPVPVSSKEVGRELTAKLAAAEAAALLGGGTELRVDDESAAGSAAESSDEGAWRALQPGDLAVLVRTNHQAERVRRHLEQLGIPSVSAGRGSVMASPALTWICAWLDAIADPGRDRPARALATTPMFGWTALELASALAESRRGRRCGPRADS